MHTNGSEMYKESVVHVQSCVLLIRPTDFFWPFSLLSLRIITRFCILFEQTMDINKSFAFNLG